MRHLTSKLVALVAVATLLIVGATVVSSQTEPPIEHVSVRQGESITGVARRLCPGSNARINAMAQAIVRANPWASGVIHVGTVLHIPTGACPAETVTTTTVTPTVTTTVVTVTTTPVPPTTVTLPTPPTTAVPSTVMTTTTVRPTTTTVRPTTTTSTTVAVTTVPPHHGGDLTYVDASAIPAPRPGRTGIAVVAGPQPTPDQHGVGAFRTDCTFSHMNFDDPIVYPGVQNATHLHAYYGNNNADYRMTTADNNAPSTCNGAGANRSAYWVPAMIDANGRPIVSNYLQLYYKTGYFGVPAHSVRVFPAGLRMVAGQPVGAMTADPTEHTYWYCRNQGAYPGQIRTKHIPACPAGDTLVMAVMFPQCWNGRDLDSPDHRSHMAYPIAPNGCPTSHPVALPEIIQHVWYEVPSGVDTSTWRLSSDRTDRPAGWSAHADWWNGWDVGILDQIRRNCWNPGMNCSMNLIGNNQQLQWRFT